MTIYFLLFAGLLVAAALGIILPPLWRQRPIAGDAADSPNLAIARQRLGELREQLQAGVLSQADYESQRRELELSLSDDLAVGRPQSSKPAGRWLAVLLLIAVPAFSIGLYALLGNFQAVEPTPEMLGQQPGAPNLADIEKMVEKLARRMATDRDNAEGWMMLGKSYKYLQQYPKAVASFKEAHRLLGDQPEVLVQYAEALAYANNEQLAGQPAALIDKALALEPNNISALWFGGMAKAQAGDYPAASERWQKLSALLPPGSQEQQEVQGLLAKVASTPESAQAATPTQTGDVALVVNVSLAPELQAKTQPNDTVFIYAQALSGPKMPLAIVRKTVAELPVTVTLTDAQAMLPAMKLSNFAEVKLLARVSKTGSATAQAGDLLGSIAAVPVTDKTRHTLIINGAVK